MGEKRIALLIGISNYQFATSLRNPINDVEAIEKALKRIGFDIILLKDTTFKDLRLALNSFGTKLNDYDVGLFYFAGHGIQIKGHNYLIPADANPLNENQVEFDCINANLILSIMEDAKNETNFIFLDACRNNPFERSWHRSPTVAGLSYMSAPYGTLIAYSTAPDKTALDGEYYSNSPYTQALIEEILSPDLTILQVLQRVRSKLIQRTNGEQVPWESTSLLNDIIFNDNRYFSIDTFCQSVMYNSDTDVVLNNLNLSSWDMTRISRSGIQINNDDKADGVIEVYYKEGLNFFDVFDKLEIKIHKDGKRVYNLYTVSKSASDVTLISQQLYNRLGAGLYDERRHSSFRDLDKIKLLARGRAKSFKDECFTNWYFEYVSFTLYYLRQPKRQFIFKVSFEPKKKVIAGTIMELLSSDYHNLLKSALKINSEVTENGRFEDYSLKLEHPELNFFDKAVIRLFDSEEHVDSSINLFLSHSISKTVDINYLSSLITSITRIYGTDTRGEGYLSGFEIEGLKSDLYWSGRTWDLNIQHQIMDTDSAIEDMLYGIHLNYHAEDGLELTIFGFEDLLKYVQL